MSFGSTLVDVVTVTVPVAGTLGGGWLVQRNERTKLKEQQKSAREAAERAEKAAAQESRHRVLADVMTTGSAWRAAVSGLEAALATLTLGRTAGLPLAEFSEAQAAFGTAWYVALNSVGPGAVYDALKGKLSLAYEDDIAGHVGAGEYSQALDVARIVNSELGTGLGELQDAVHQENRSDTKPALSPRD
jgi:hypothetical protein